ncbi:hypothetical protein ACFP2F_04395 [Hymenobacter artigasi]|uniref:Uncharacterized protein n=1 Tax=Hymenobacter artigasi TaxID=2719616 RepID=A0ABX1HI74_9BACT|nr:hypothetical protein [Hymenobacter artigasi]NKI88847.1 hypothetical protein [Hymenobacter artigasi]
MTREKEVIYRRLLYIGLVDIRNFSYRATQEPTNPWLPPLNRDEIMAYIAGLSDLLHDLAMHSAKNFEGWNDWHDEYFALGYEGFCEAFAAEKYPSLIHDVAKLLKSA